MVDTTVGGHGLSSPSGAHSLRATWIAIAITESLILAGIFMITVGLRGSIRFCQFELGCDGDTASGRSGGWAVVALLGVIVLCASPYVLARGSQRRAPVRIAALAIVVFIGTWIVAGGLIAEVGGDSDSGLILALGSAGAIAVRAPSERAARVRIVTMGTLAALSVILGVLGTNGAMIVLSVITLPAIGLADTIAVKSMQPKSG